MDRDPDILHATRAAIDRLRQITSELRRTAEASRNVIATSLARRAEAEALIASSRAARPSS